MAAPCLQERAAKMFEITSLAHLADQFDAFFIDQFGVLIDGKLAYDGAADALKILRASGTQNLLLSNSGKRSEPNEIRLTKLGFDRSSYQMVLTSGEVAYRELSARLGRSIQKGALVFVISRDLDHSCVDGLEIIVTSNISEASLIIIAGSEGDRFSLETYEKLLKDPAKANVPCWCTNPDTHMLTQEGTTFGAGQIARLYAQLGGTVQWFGKPHPAIYHMALEVLSTAKPQPKKVLCIGDSIEHDIAGGHRAGLKTALVRTGIYKDTSLDELKSMAQNHKAAPDYIIPVFAF